MLLEHFLRVSAHCFGFWQSSWSLIFSDSAYADSTTFTSKATKAKKTMQTNAIRTWNGIEWLLLQPSHDTVWPRSTVSLAKDPILSLEQNTIHITCIGIFLHERQQEIYEDVESLVLLSSHRHQNRNVYFASGRMVNIIPIHASYHIHLPLSISEFWCSDSSFAWQWNVLFEIFSFGKYGINLNEKVSFEFAIDISLNGKWQRWTWYYKLDKMLLISNLRCVQAVSIVSALIL